MSYRNWGSRMVLLLAIQINVTGQSPPREEISRVYALGEVEVIAEIRDNSVPDSILTLLGQPDITDAAGMLPGVTLSAFGGRNERTIYVRGFDLRSAPVFIDGIPVYVPFDGYMDLGRLYSADFSKITVVKGYVPVGYGANTTVGAINLVSHHPENKLDISAYGTFGSGRELRSGIRIGTLANRYYLSGIITQSSRAFFPLSARFDTTGRAGSEDGGNRDNAYHSDVNINLKAGFTPNRYDEYSLNFIYHHGKKGTPPYSGTDNLNRERFWQWPYWDKQSLYFIGKKRVGTRTFVIMRTYYDAFRNQLNSYDDNSYTTQERRYAFSSFYDDYSLGGNLELTNGAVKNNLFKFSVHLKDDHHKEYNEGEPERKFHDRNWSAGLEDAINIGQLATWTTSLEVAGRQGIRADNYRPEDSTIIAFPVSGATAFNTQSALHLQPSDGFTIHGAASYKTRFATMKERYAYRSGYTLPNPDLKPERVMQLEIGSIAGNQEHYTVGLTLFYSYLSDALVSVDHAEPGISQIRNIGEARHAGVEFSAHFCVSERFAFRMDYTYTNLANLTDPDTRLINVPEHDLSAYSILSPSNAFKLVLNAGWMSERFSTTYGTVANGFFNLNGSFRLDLFRHVDFEAGVKNILDADYAYMEGFPEPGRTLFFTTRFRLTSGLTE